MMTARFEGLPPRNKYRSNKNCNRLADDRSPPRVLSLHLSAQRKQVEAANVSLTSLHALQTLPYTDCKMSNNEAGKAFRHLISSLFDRTLSPTLVKQCRWLVRSITRQRPSRKYPASQKQGRIE